MPYSNTTQMVYILRGIYYWIHAQTRQARKQRYGPCSFFFPSDFPQHQGHFSPGSDGSRSEQPKYNNTSATLVIRMFLGFYFVGDFVCLCISVSSEIMKREKNAMGWDQYFSQQHYLGTDLKRSRDSPDPITFYVNFFRIYGKQKKKTKRQKTPGTHGNKPIGKDIHPRQI